MNVMCDDEKAVQQARKVLKDRVEDRTNTTFDGVELVFDELEDKIPEEVKAELRRIPGVSVG